MKTFHIDVIVIMLAMFVLMRVFLGYDITCEYIDCDYYYKILVSVESFV